jgi:hypothetical protein
VRRVSSTVVGVHALTLTTGVMKEWVFYVAPVRTLLRFTKTFRARSLATMFSAWPLKNESGSRIVLSFRSRSFSVSQRRS